MNRIHKRFRALVPSILISVSLMGTEWTDSAAFSKRQEALIYISAMSSLPQSEFWPHVDPKEFTKDLEGDIRQPLRIYEGKVTNFCSYAALTYIPFHYDPLGFVQFMFELYKNGKARLGKVNFEPGDEVRNVAGLLKNKGFLDIAPANQVWFLCLADRFKGYLNVFNKQFDPGDENNLCAATNFSKFNRMIRQLFPMKVKAKGFDFLRPAIKDMILYLEEKLQTGTLFMYVNNRKLYKIKDNTASRVDVPTHFLVLLSMTRVDNRYRLTYWDYGRISVQELSASFIRKITFGVTHCTLR
ncbi:MAG TPA: hypothetical protein VLJ68_00670 [Chitinophagaceae bacterium]|nr:hypothetical protein [Chitinophagaceae bacterium]